jgi:hypothetical protein
MMIDATVKPRKSIGLNGETVARETLIVRHVLLPIACRTSSSEGSKARSCLVVSQAPKEDAWNCDLLCDQQLPIQTCSTGNGWV